MRMLGLVDIVIRQSQEKSRGLPLASERFRHELKSTGLIVASNSERDGSRPDSEFVERFMGPFDKRAGVAGALIVMAGLNAEGEVASTNDVAAFVYRTRLRLDGYLRDPKNRLVYRHVSDSEPSVAA